jgi:hypothetical protein
MPLSSARKMLIKEMIRRTRDFVRQSECCSKPRCEKSLEKAHPALLEENLEGLSVSK